MTHCGAVRWTRDLLALIAAAAALDATVVEPHWIQVTRHRVTLPLDAPLTIAHVTDLHSRGLGFLEWPGRVV